jgi:hypothetical protein
MRRSSKRLCLKRSISSTTDWSCSANGKYDEAAKAFAEYKTLIPDDPRAKELAVSADKVKALADTNKIYTISNLQDQNSELSDMGATFYKGGIVFSSNQRQR